MAIRRERDDVMKLFCKGKQHWEINNGKLILGAETDELLAEQLTKMTARLEAEIRLDIYDKICAIDFTSDRKLIVKNGIENVALQVQDICAQIALGESK
jgi:hypothetical protein